MTDCIKSAAATTGLNPEQQEAVEHRDGPLIVLAGPGTGKTHVITCRIVRLIEEAGVEPESILALTFTNKAAEEMRTRLAEVLGSSTRAERIVAGTFHSFGLRTLRRFADLVGWRAEPQLFDEARQRALMREIIDATGIGREEWYYDPYAQVETALKFISEARNWARSPQETLEFAQRWKERIAPGAWASSPCEEIDSEQGDARTSAPFARAGRGTPVALQCDWGPLPCSGLSEEERLAEEMRCRRFEQLAGLYHAFDEACFERGWVTFDDLQTRPLRLLGEFDFIRAIARTEHRHIIVDEFQDVNRAQVELLKQLAGPNHDLCVVGDDDQSIYAFRGAMQSSFRTFAEHWPAARTITLDRNYRSTAVILDAAHRIISQCTTRFAPDKHTYAAGDRSELKVPIEAVTYRGTDGCGAIIGRMIQEAVREGQVGYKDHAVLVRTNTDLHRIAAALEVMEIPVEIPESGPTFDHPAVLDAMSWLRLLADPYDDVYALRLLARPPYSISLTMLTGWHRQYRLWAAEQGSGGAPTPLQGRGDPVGGRGSGEEERGSGEVGETSNPEHRTPSPDIRPFVEHLTETKPHDHVERFGSNYRRLFEAALTASIDDLARQVIAATGLLTLDPVDSVARRARVEHLGRWLAFISERMSCLDPPRRVRQFLRYLDDLTGGGDRIPRSAESRMYDGVEFSDRDAVRLLTAHSAKGLQFDTVFLPRINPRYGYPTLERGGDDELLPEELKDQEDWSHEDDERRVFFVAMTRAQRRLILLAQTKQESGRRCSPSIFWNEIAETPDPTISITRHDLSDSTSDDLIEETALAPGNDAGQIVRHRERLRVRHDIFAALSALSDPDLDPSHIDALRERLTAAALRLPLLAAPDHARLEALLDRMPREHRDSLKAFVEEIESAGPLVPLLPNPQPPLSLSYSDVWLYNTCPRCYWLRNVVRVPQRPSAGMDFGSIIHRALEFFYKRMRDCEGGLIDGPPPGLDDLLRLGHEAYEDKRPPELVRSRDYLRRIEKALTQYYENMHSPSINAVYIEERIAFDYPHNGHNHRFVARIDRIDHDDAGHHVIDYKTGAPKKSQLTPARTDLQLGIYYLAMRRLLEEEEPAGSAQYWLTRTNERGVLNFADVNVDSIRRQINEAIDGILAGEWTPSPTCGKCELLEEIEEED